MIRISLIVLCLTGCIPLEREAEDLTAHAAATLAAHTSGLFGMAPIVPDEPESDECENCGGSGKVGDGRVFVECPVCDGTGKKTDKPPVKPVAPVEPVVPDEPNLPEPVKEVKYIKSTIQMYSRPGCPSCVQWKNKEAPKLKRAGWVVPKAIVDQYKAVPYFDIMLPGKKAIRHNGYLTMDQLRAYMGLQVVRVKTTGSYVPRWQNNDGLIFEEHARIYHKIDTTGLTYEQIARMRDADHDRYGPYHSRIRR